MAKTKKELKPKAPEAIKKPATLALISLVILMLLLGLLIRSGFHWLIILQPILFAGIILCILSYFKVDKKTLAILFFIFLLGFTIRAQNIQPRYDYFFGFDSYFHARWLGMTIEQGGIPEYDTMAYYSIEHSRLETGFLYTFLWNVSTVFYNAFTLFAPYDKALLISFVKIFPPLMGALIAMLMFFLAKELFGRKAAFIGAFTAATLPAFMYRTMAGFYEEDAMGYLGFVVGFTFLIRALKAPRISRKSILDSVFAGLGFSFMSWGWRMYIVIPVLLMAATPFIVLLFLQVKAMKKELSLNSIKTFAVHYTIPVLLFLALTLPVRGLDLMDRAFGYIASVLPFTLETAELGFMLGLGFIVFAFAFIIFIFRESLGSLVGSNFFRAAIALLLFFSTIFVLTATYGDHLTGGFFEERFVETGLHGQLVGEENPGYNTFGYKYNFFIVLAILSLFLVPVWVYIKKDDIYSPLAFWWVAMGLVLAWHKLKFTFSFGPTFGLAAAFCAAFLFYFAGKSKDLTGKKVAFALIAVFLIASIATASYYIQHNMKQPSLERQPEWKETLHWFRDSTPEDAKIFNWWSQGHWLTFVSERTVFTDNRNIAWDTTNAAFGNFITSTDVNEALEIFKEHKADYLLLSSDFFAGNFLAFYSYGHNVPRDEILQHPELAPKIQMAGGQYIPCRPADDGVYNCGGNLIAEEQLASLPNKWQRSPTNVEGVEVPEWFYRDKDNIGVALLQPQMNESMLAKIWFNAEEIRPYFELVHTATGDNTVKVYKVNLPE